MPQGTSGSELGERAVAATVVAIALALCGWWAAQTMTDRNDTEVQALTALRTAQSLLSEHARGSLDETRHALERLALRAVNDGSPAAASAASWRAWLSGWLAQLPGVAMLGHVGTDGQVTAVWAEGTDADLSGTDVVAAHRDGARLVVSPPGAGLPGRTPLFRLSLRIEENGRFVGVAVAALRTDYFADFYRAVGLPDLPLTIAVLRENGTLLVLEPRDKAPDVPSSGYPFGTNPQTGEHTVALRGMPYLVSIGRLPNAPVLVAACVSEEAVLAPWRARAVMSGGLAAACVTVIALLGWMVGRSLRRERRAWNALRAANAELEIALSAQEDARRQAETASAAKSRLLAAISHDLGQPLRALQFHLEAINDHALAEPERALITRMRTAAAVQQDMVDQLIAASALEYGVVEAEWRRFPLAPLLTEAADLCRNEAARNGVDLRLVPCSLHLCSDPVLLRRLLMNLIANAARYTTDGRVLVGCRRGEDALRIEVWDTGPGIRPEETHTIFEEFHRGASSAGSTGLGLGLSIVRRLADALDVTVTAASLPSRGSCFTIAIPWDHVHESVAYGESIFQPFRTE